jgi:hypothetical protein
MICIYLKNNFMNNCLICNTNKLKFLFYFYSQILPNRFRSLQICKVCGHIQISPRFEHLEYASINNLYFSKVYANLTNHVNNNQSNLKKLLTVQHYVKPFLYNGIKVLDIGAGEAWSRNLFKNFDVEYDFIESVDLLSEKILDSGGKKVSNSIDDDISDFYGKYDLILFRHVLEHLLNPREAIEKCRLLLNDTGKLYLEVPNGIPSTSENISKIYKKGFRTSFIRPIHISYFCVENINLLTSFYGLNPVILEVKNEIHGVFEKCDMKNIDITNNYKRNRKIMLNHYYKFFLTDLKQIIKSIFYK